MYTVEAENISFSFIPKAITKKRFIKLLMGMGHQRNEANKMHQEYMKTHKSRSEIGLIFFTSVYDAVQYMNSTLKTHIGEREIDFKKCGEIEYAGTLDNRTI